MAEEAVLIRRRLTVTGVVQGVGFRPFVHRLAKEHGLAGWALNNGAGVVIEVEGPPEPLDLFQQDLRHKCPPLGRIDRIVAETHPPSGEQDFKILASADDREKSALIPPDAALCGECKAEMEDPEDRRYRYPFINCTHCGPRFTIVEEVPYDRTRTTMRAFQMCRDCELEYTDPADRRFHAEPVACPECGPELSWLDGNGEEESRGETALRRAAERIAAGDIVGLKGLGGFHLVCDATNSEAIKRLRERKDRPGKPLAVMSRTVEEIAAYAHLSRRDRDLLTSPESPIVLVQRKPGPVPAEGIAPGLNEFGVMLPYTPLHALLFESGREFPALVMTSGNRRDEPIARTNEEALETLRGIADGYLVHNRLIHNRADDSIVRTLKGEETQILRRARGYVPRSVPVDIRDRIFAAGPELKNTFCLTRNGEAFLSQHIGDLDDERALAFCSETFEKYTRLLDLRPDVVCCDLHPDYLSTRFAEEYAAAQGLPLVRIQHHEAHIGSVLAEHTGWSNTGTVLGASFDGTGYGPDRTIWGGEFLLFKAGNSTRVAHFECFPLPGGDAAVRNVWRSALSVLLTSGIEEVSSGALSKVSEEERNTVTQMIRKGMNCPLTSSAGRLFDAAAVLAGLGPTASYEAEAAMRLETLCGNDFSPYPIETTQEFPARIRLEPIVRGMLSDIGNPPTLSSRFHATMAHAILEVARRTRDNMGTNVVALSGGVFQNRVLVEFSRSLLEEHGFRVLTNRLVPPNDGGISLGQAWIASRRKES